MEVDGTSQRKTYLDVCGVKQWVKSSGLPREDARVSLGINGQGI